MSMQPETSAAPESGSVPALDLAITLARNWKLLVLGPLLVSALAYAGTYIIKPTYTARTVFMPPQQQQVSAAAAAMQSLGALAGLAGNGIKNPVDQYISLMQSATVANGVIDTYKLMDVYHLQTREEARKALATNVKMDGGKKDGLITVEVDDEDPKRAAAIANSYVDQLRKLTAEFVMSEAQQRRALFERQLRQTHERLLAAQKDLQGSGINAGVLRSEPKAAAELFASLKAQVMNAQIRLQVMRRYLTDDAPEVKLAQSNLIGLQSELRRAEGEDKGAAQGDYIEKYREFKYQETLFELFAKQFELAKLDETREGAVIQVIDVATPPERKSKPKRGLVVTMAFLGMVFFLLIFVLLRQSWRLQARDKQVAKKLALLKSAF